MSAPQTQPLWPLLAPDLAGRLEPADHGTWAMDGLRQLWGHPASLAHRLYLPLATLHTWVAEQPQGHVSLIQHATTLVLHWEDGVMLGQVDAHGGVDFWPWAMRTRYATALWLARNAHDLGLSQSLAALPRLARTWQEAQKGACIPGWSILHGGLTHAPAPDWVRDLPTSTQAFTTLMQARLLALGATSSRAHCSLSGAGFCQHGDFLPASVSRGTQSCWTQDARNIGPAVHAAMHAFMDAICTSVPEYWLLDQRLCPRPAGVSGPPLCSRGTLLFLAVKPFQGAAPSAHALLHAHHHVPPRAAQAIAAIGG